MGSRITRVATHLSENAVQERMQGEQRRWCRRRWEIIYQALTAPRKAEDIARTVGVSLATVHQVISSSKRGGVAAIETPGKGGRRHQYLTLEQERAFLQPFLARSAQGERATVAEIHHAFEERVGHLVDDSSIYRLLNRHGWRQRSAGVKAGSGCAPALESTRARSGTGVPCERAASRRVPAKATRQLSSRCYPSDLTDQEWAILEPVIPPAKEGGRPRTTD